MNKYENIAMPEQHRQLANKYEDIVNLQGGRGISSGYSEGARGAQPPAPIGAPLQ